MQCAGWAYSQGGRHQVLSTAWYAHQLEAIGPGAAHQLRGIVEDKDIAVDADGQAINPYQMDRVIGTDAQCRPERAARTVRDVDGCTPTAVG